MVKNSSIQRGVWNKFVGETWPITHTLTCEFTEIHLARLTHPTMALTYYSTFVDMMKIGFARLSEFGLKNRQIDRLTFKRPKCRQDILTSSVVSLNEFAPILFILLSGYTVFAIMCIIEINMFYKKKLREN
ncbi:hypothetical protein TKK_0015820 [Trichogramma kaykai]